MARERPRGGAWKHTEEGRLQAQLAGVTAPCAMLALQNSAMYAMTEQRPALIDASVRVHYGQEATEKGARHGQITPPCAPWRPIPLRSASKQRRAICDGTAPRAMRAPALLYVTGRRQVDGAADRAFEVSAKMRGSVPRKLRQFRRSQPPRDGEVSWWSP